MTIEDVKSIVASGESEEVEFKKTTGELEAAARTICAMLNGYGGVVLLGVGDAGNIMGQEISAHTRTKIANTLRRIEPYVLLRPDEAPLDDARSVIVVSVPGSESGPYTYDGRPYVREGPTTRRMPQERYEQLLKERMHSRQRWELMPAQEFDLEDIDNAEVIRSVDAAIQRGRMDEPGTRDVEALLTGFGVMRNGKLLNAAVALFGKQGRMLPYYPQCQLRMARFRGTTKDAFEDNKQVHGHTFDLFMEAQRFLRQHLPVAGRIVPNLFERVDDPLYPLEALREALANAICHRDYATASGSLGLAIYDDRLEISNTGRLHFGLTPKDLFSQHASLPWNPLIAEVFFRRGLIELWGRGTLKMGELTEKAGLAAPEFEEQPGALVVRFRPSHYTPPGRVTHDLSELQQDLLRVLADSGMSRALIQQNLRIKVTTRTIQRELGILRTLGLIELHGSGRGAYWTLKGKQ